ncbi:hypothetical protein AGR4A_pTi0169 [Agrobacterium tumefaciens str. B6]|uniref:Uncharacterized protein n=1 Tax=Agrobacterium tumefaciens str. B6 TaxID=1183423 RepID=A0A822VDD0_AGRTU|nr:hypothetical protein AGR4A_pTi0169 [Agrobacterium tumefaciens str. B6]
MTIRAVRHPLIVAITIGFQLPRSLGAAEDNVARTYGASRLTLSMFRIRGPTNICKYSRLKLLDPNRSNARRGAIGV